MADPTPQTWAASVLKALGIHQTPGAVQALTGWARAEGGHWSNQARYNPLNTTQPAPGAGNTGSQGNIKVYKTWDQGIQATVQTLRNGRYGGILQALGTGDPMAVASAIGKTPWGTSGDLVRKTIAGTPRLAGVHAFDVAGGASGSGGAQSAQGTAVAAPEGAGQALPPAASTAGAEALLASMQRPQPRSTAGLQAPSFSAQPTLPTGFQQPAGGGGPAPKVGVDALLGVAAAAQDTSAPTSGAAGEETQAAGAGAAATSRAKGTVHVAPGANRKGVELQKPILGFLEQVSAAAGRPVDITTGTNHDEHTTSGNVSDHWAGNAGDLGVGADARKDRAAGRKGDLIAAHAIQVAAGIPFQKAYAMARKGGVFNFETKQGRVQIIWRSMVGGNHYDHVHAGLNPAR